MPFNQSPQNVEGKGSGSVYGSGGGSSGGWLSKNADQYSSAINSAVDTYRNVSDLFETKDKGQLKRTASADQERIQNAGKLIGDMVASGRMDAGEGLAQINYLMQSVQTWGSDDAYARAGKQNALLFLMNVKGNIQSKANWALAKPGDKQGGAGLAGISPDPGFQQSWVKNAMLNKLAGFDRGNQQLAGSPIEKLFEGPFDVAGGFKNFMSQAQSTVPTYQEPGRFEALRKRLAGGLDGSYFKG